MTKSRIKHFPCIGFGRERRRLGGPAPARAERAFGLGKAREGGQFCIRDARHREQPATSEPGLGPHHARRAV